MENRYKLILSTKRSYREAELSAEQSKKVIGTGLESDIRFREEDFFEPFVFTAVLDQDRCQLECGENVYFSAGDARKLMLSELTPGGEITVKYRESGVEVMRLHFMVDFDYYPHTYDRRIDLSGIQEIRLGDRAGAQIRLGAGRAADCSVLIQKNGSQYVLRPEHTDDTVRLNGNALKYPAALKQLDFIAVGPYSFCFQNGGLYTDSNSDIVYTGVTWTDEKESISRHEYPKFNRSTRIHELLPEEKIEILDPPNKPKKPKANWAMRLLPAIAMIGVVVLLRGFMSTSNITYILLSVCTMGIGVATSVATIITEKKDYKEESAKREEKYRRYIENKRKTIEEARAEETRILENRYISASRELDQIESLSHGFQFLGLDLLQTPQNSEWTAMMWLIPLLCLVSSWASQFVMMKMQPGMQQQQGCMKVTMYALPLISVYFSWVMPGAIGFYWIISTLVSFGSTLLMNRFFSPAQLTAKAEAQRAALRYQEEAAIAELSPAVQRQLAEKLAPSQKTEEKKNVSGQSKKGKNKSKKPAKSGNDAYLGTKK